MPTLVVIDMQEEFEAANCPKTIAACQREIRAAIGRDDPIIFVEYGDKAPPIKGYPSIPPVTLPALTDLTKGYDHAHTVVKFDNSGTPEVIKTIRDHDLPCDLRICGVNANCCVRLTVEGLRKQRKLKFPMVAVEDAINMWSLFDNDSYDHARTVVSYVRNYRTEVDCLRLEPTPYTRVAA